MASVSQNGRRKARPWTAQDQIVAEVAAACGVSCVQIGKLLESSDVRVKRHLSAVAAEKNRQSALRWKKANPEKVAESRRAWDQQNPEKKSQHDRLYRERHYEQKRERDRRYRLANAGKVREWMKRWQQANRDKVRRKNYQWRQRNLEKMREIRRKWREANPDRMRELHRRRNVLRRSARRRALSPVTRAQIDARFALWNNHCAFCAVDAIDPRNRGYERLTVEHVLALNKGGLDEAANVIPSCHSCNSSKHDSPVEDWYRQQPWFTEARWRKIQRHCPAAVVGQIPLALAA